MELKFIWMGNYKSIGDVTKLAMDPKFLKVQYLVKKPLNELGSG